jgi:hypothetical protein
MRHPLAKVSLTRWESQIWRWLWRVGPRLVAAFQHLAERYQSVRAEHHRASRPIIRPDVEMVSLPRVSVPLPVDRPKAGVRPSRQPPPVPPTSGQKLPPLPSQPAGPNTTSSVWDDNEFGK